MLKMSSSHTTSRTETLAPLINCVIDDTLLKTMPDMACGASVHRHHELDRFAAAFLPTFSSQPGLDLCCWVAKAI